MSRRNSRRLLRLTLGGVMAAVMSCQCPPPPQGVTPARAALVVQPTALEVTPDAVVLRPGAEQQFQVIARLSDGTGTPVIAAWTATGGSITSTGLFQAGTVPGAYLVVARTGDNALADTATVTIRAPRLIAVEISPAAATLTATTSQMFTVTGQYSDGTAGPVSVTWSATGGTVSSGLYTAGAVAGTFQVVATSDDGGLSDTAPVTIELPVGLAVRVQGIPNTIGKWLLQNTDTSVAGQKSCPADAVSYFAALDLAVAEVWPGCKTELSVFAADAAPRLDTAPTPVVTDGKNLILEQLSPRWVVKLRVTYEYTGGDMDAETGRVMAVGLYNTNMMGLTFEFGDGPTFVSPDPDQSGKVSPAAKAIAGGCDAIAAEPGLTAPDRMNVFLIREDQWPATWKEEVRYGYNCYKELKPHPGIVLLREKHVPETLAHEVGHGLSLDHAGVGFILAPKWDVDNIMQSSVWNPVDSLPAVKSFTLGQAYRANFNQVSWLNASGLGGGPTKTCQPAGPTDPPLTWPCPVIFLKWGP